jgi:hypothetical protein
MKTSRSLFLMLAVVLTAGLTSLSIRSSAKSEVDPGPNGCRIVTGYEIGKCSKNTEDTYTCFKVGETDPKDCTSSD